MSVKGEGSKRRKRLLLVRVGPRQSSLVSRFVCRRIQENIKGTGYFSGRVDCSWLSLSKVFSPFSSDQRWILARSTEGGDPLWLGDAPHAFARAVFLNAQVDGFKCRAGAKGSSPLLAIDAAPTYASVMLFTGAMRGCKPCLTLLTLHEPIAKNLSGKVRR